MRTRVALITISLLTVSTAFAAPRCQPKKFTPLPLLSQSNYHEMRARMLAAGWFPIQTKPRRVNQADDPDISSGNGKEFWNKGYLEVESCAGSGLSPCAFRWADKFGNHARLVTEGEEDPKHKIYAMGKTSAFLCPGDE